jgi:LPXTG-site transpeptidase (sortase) family protein
MITKTLSRRILYKFILPGLAIFVLILVCFHPRNSNISADTPVKESQVLPTEAAIAPATQALPDIGLPMRLKIPEINVDATIEYVGLNSSGAMDVPKGPVDVAWLQLGPRPGENGSAVIDGHYGTWKNGDHSVFDDLKKLTTGDRLSIVDNKGLIISFVVRESQSYDQNADAKDVFSSSDGKSHLNLITCENWDTTSASYTKRLVVFTDKE